VLLVLARNSNSQPKRKYYAIRELDLFNGGGLDKLWAFLFQYQVYFRASEEKFTEDLEKIFFVILYLRNIVSDYFEPFINELDLYYFLDFLEDLSAFVQCLSNVFGLYSLENNNEDTIVTISFLHDSKTTKYFIHFTKYQNQIQWDDWSFYKVVKDTIPIRISDELWYMSQLYYGPVVTYCIVYHYTKKATLARPLANKSPAIYIVLWTGILSYLYITN